jgi:glutathione S-transferase
MALKHKGLEFTSFPVCLGDKDAIAFSRGSTVPVIIDGENVVRDSWEIAVHLEMAHADAPSLFGGSVGMGATRFVNAWADRTLNIALAPLIIRDILDIVDPDDREYFRYSMERRFKRSLEEVQAGREDRLGELYRALDPVRAVLRSGQPFLAGDDPAYADYIAFSPLQWARIASPFQLLEPNDPVYEWRERMLDLYDGYARNTPAFDSD